MAKKKKEAKEEPKKSKSKPWPKASKNEKHMLCYKGPEDQLQVGNWVFKKDIYVEVSVDGFPIDYEASEKLGLKVLIVVR